MVSGNAPLVVIVGQTASGKTALGIELAKEFNGEIICADSRTVYKDMNIGTAKPTSAEQQGIPHHMLDVVKPGDPFSAADFKKLANRAIDDIHARGKLAIMVGGTGLYIDAVLYDYQFLPVPSPNERARLQSMSIQELQEEITARGFHMPENKQNPRHLMRVLETNGLTASKHSIRENTLVIGIDVDQDELKQRIANRVDDMLSRGFVEEVKKLYADYPADTEALRAPGYKAFHDYAIGKISIDEATASFVRNDRLLAKRQRTWFKRNNSIQWVNKQAEAVELLTSFLNNYRI